MKSIESILKAKYIFLILNNFKYNIYSQAITAWSKSCWRHMTVSVDFSRFSIKSSTRRNDYSVWLKYESGIPQRFIIESEYDLQNLEYFK